LNDIEDPFIAQQRIAVFSQTTTQILSRTGYKPTPEQLTMLTQIIERMWCTIARCEEFQLRTASYALPYHTLVVLFLMRQGMSITVRDVVIELLPCIPFLQCHLPSRNDCHPFISRLTTRAEKDFKSYINYCSEQLLEHSC
jgi:hypothetical protein